MITFARMGGFLLASMAAAVVWADTYVVDTAGDPGIGRFLSLRGAILAANNHAGLDRIEFDIDQLPPFTIPTISPTSPLPDITDPVVIDGTTETAGKVQLNGANAGLGADVDGLCLTAGGSTIRGLVINRFDGDGIDISGPGGNVIEGNFIGVDVTGTLALGNAQGPITAGVHIRGSPGNRVGGTTPGSRNVISGNAPGDGITISGVSATGNLVQGNYIGTNAAGNAPLRNQIGVDIWSSDNTIGGQTAAAKNVISGNFGSNVHIFDGGSGASGNRIQGNYIGTDATGTFAVDTNALGAIGVNIIADDNLVGGIPSRFGNLQPRNVISGNPQDGITIFSGNNNVIQGNYIGTNALGNAAVGNGSAGINTRGTGTLIGGDVEDAGNLISGNFRGIDLFSAVGTIIQGNRIGLNANGTAALGNVQHGILMAFTEGARIGGTTDHAGNIIVGSGFFGISLGGGSVSNVIEGNTIGMVGMGNASAGIVLYSDKTVGNTIGGSPGARNTIAGNGGDGVWVTCTPSCADDNRILSNSIHSNERLGINLDPVASPPDGVTENDPGDADGGPNSLQNYSELTSAIVSSDGTLQIRGILRSRINGTYTVEFFRNSSCDASGHGEGQSFLDSTLVHTDSFLGVAVIDSDIGRGAFASGFLTSTATSSAGDTSEFSACIPIQGDGDDDTVPDPADNCPSISNLDQADGDADGVGNLCDSCPGNVSGAAVDASGCPVPIPGDFDLNGDVGDLDFQRFQLCITGPGITQDAPFCLPARLDGDTDVDLSDASIFWRCFSGSLLPAAPDCAP